MTQICAFPGCGKKLRPDGISGVCRTHNHRRPYCRCSQCTGVPKPKYRAITREEADRLNEKTVEKVRKAPRVPGEGDSIAALCEPLSASVQPRRMSWANEPLGLRGGVRK